MDSHEVYLISICHYIIPATYLCVRIVVQTVTSDVLNHNIHESDVCQADCKFGQCDLFVTIGDMYVTHEMAGSHE